MLDKPSVDGNRRSPALRDRRAGRGSRPEHCDLLSIHSFLHNNILPTTDLSTVFQVKIFSVGVLLAAPGTSAPRFSGILREDFPDPLAVIGMQSKGHRPVVSANDRLCITKRPPFRAATTTFVVCCLVYLLPRTSCAPWFASDDSASHCFTNYTHRRSHPADPRRCPGWPRPARRAGSAPPRTCA